MQNPRDILKETPKNNVFIANKEEGETPLECLTRLKETGFLPNDKFTYAGRLDPMASGLMLFLRGDAISQKEEYLNLNKEYIVEVLFGLSTDTGDVLGKIDSVPNSSGHSNSDVVFDIKNIKNICDSLIGDTEVPYPWYSSKTINGIALHEIARGDKGEDESENETETKTENENESSMIKPERLVNTLDTLERPMTKLSIQNIEILDFYMMPASELLSNVNKRIAKVKGDFRQDEILKKWYWFLNENYNNDANFPILKIKVECKSGSYMRTLAEILAEKLKTHGLAYSIKRIRVGEYVM